MTDTNSFQTAEDHPFCVSLSNRACHSNIVAGSTRYIPVVRLQDVHRQKDCGTCIFSRYVKWRLSYSGELDWSVRIVKAN
jgi:hypothetical protein